MKTTNIILILLGVVLIVGIVLFYTKFKKNQSLKTTESENQKKEESDKKSNGGGGAPFSQNVAKLQVELNNKLPAGYERLKIDGQYGPKTKQAVEYLESTIPSKTNASNSKGTFDAEIAGIKSLVDKGKSIGQFLLNNTPLESTPLGLLNKIF